MYLIKIVLKYMKQNLRELKGEIGKHVIIAGDFNPLSRADIKSNLKIPKNTKAWSKMINHLNLIDI